MIPIPNVLAGFLIGIAVNYWLSVIGSSFGWGFVSCIYTSLSFPDRVKYTTESFKQNRKRLIFNSPIITFYLIEYMTAFITSMFVGFVVFFIKNLTQ